MLNRRIDDPVVPFGAGASRQSVAGRIAFRDFRIEAGMAGMTPQIDEDAGHAGDHFAIFDHRVVIPCIGERAGQMMPDFGNAGFGCECGIPLSRLWACHMPEWCKLWLTNGALQTTEDK